MKNIRTHAFVFTAFLSLSTSTSFLAAQDVRSAPITPATMPRIGSVDERFQSYNIEMVEVTGGRFWKPYTSKAETNASAKQPSSNQPAGMDPSLYQYRPPINLANPRLRKLAAALGPAYLRVSGTWANTTWFQNSKDPPPATPPKGFNGVLTRNQWKGVVDFSQAVNAEIVTSFAISPGTRDATGAWTPDEAKQWVDYTNSIGGHIAAAEYMNEPNIAEIGGAPKGYDAAAYGRDVGAFHTFAKQSLPGLIFLGPGSAGEGTLMPSPATNPMSSANLLTATGPVFDAISYHSYGAVSSRCAMFGAAATTTAEAALSEEWLARPGQIEEFYGGIRDRFQPGKPLWNTETAQAACGGDRWASTFLDSFRYLNQLGTLAKRGVQVNMHNTLAASDYGLLDENTYAPRPNYWAALLWHKFMATIVLDTGASAIPSLHLFAHCLRNQPGGVALLVINASRDSSKSLDIRSASERYTLSSGNLQDNHVELNGVELQLTSNDTFPELKGIRNRPGALTFAPASITFLALPEAHNSSCQ
jgi:heparanase 1